jgi:hypothetical protein
MDKVKVQMMPTGGEELFAILPGADLKARVSLAQIKKVLDSQRMAMSPNQPDTEALFKDLGILRKIGNRYTVDKIGINEAEKHYLDQRIDLEGFVFANYLKDYQNPKKRKEVEAIYYRAELELGLVFYRVTLKAKTEPGVKRGRGHTSIGRHTISQFYGDPKQLNVFSEQKVANFIEATGVEVLNKPDSYGVVLNQSQTRVFEGILRVFSDTDYKGYELKEKTELSSEEYPLDKMQRAYSNIKKIPVIQLTQAEIIRLSGYEKTQGDKIDVIEAISFLGTEQFCFFWERLKKDSNGKPIRNKNGDYEKEEVMEVGTFFRIQTVREEGEFKHYEIYPSAVILDQVNNEYGGSYFLLIPNNWRDEVKQLTGKRASRYTYEFLKWLRLEYEIIRIHNAKKDSKDRPFSIPMTWEDTAITLKMPESMYKANRKRASNIIQEAYDTAIKLGYLLRVGEDGTLYLNEAYYPKPGELK